MFKAVATWWRAKREARRSALMPESKVLVTFDGALASAIFPSGETQSIAWKDVSCIAIETNDRGPLGADVWWLLEGTGGRVAYPQGATGGSEMLKHFSDRFPEFDHMHIIYAMGSTGDARFVCWQRGN